MSQSVKGIHELWSAIQRDITTLHIYMFRRCWIGCGQKERVNCKLQDKLLFVNTGFLKEIVTPSTPCKKYDVKLELSVWYYYNFIPNFYSLCYISTAFFECFSQLFFVSRMQIVRGLHFQNFRTNIQTFFKNDFYKK